MISVAILTKNSAKSLKKTLDALTPFQEVVLVDNGSTDNTLQIAAEYPNVRIHQHPFIGFGALRNQAAELCQNDWIFALDSDEVPSPALIEEIFRLALDPDCVYELCRRNVYRGKWIRGCSWHPDPQMRLYHRKKTQFGCDHLVHESLLISGMRRKRLCQLLDHTPYLSVEEFLSKMQLYSSLFAEQHRGRKKISFSGALFRAAYTFFKSYLVKRGFLDGTEGLFISIYNANCVFYKYLKLLEKS